MMHTAEKIEEEWLGVRCSERESVCVCVRERERERERRHPRESMIFSMVVTGKK
jgi:hypothetical protein